MRPTSLPAGGRAGRPAGSVSAAAMTREAAVDTREHKSDRTLAQLRPLWLDEAANLGQTPESLFASVNAASREQLEGVMVRFRDVAEALTASASAWHRE